MCHSRLRRTGFFLLVVAAWVSALAVADSPVPIATVLANPSAFDGKVFWLTGTAVQATATPGTADGVGHLTIVLKAGDKLMLALGDARRDVSALNVAAIVEARSRTSTPPTVILFGKYSKPGSPDQIDKHANGFFAISNVVSLEGNVFCLARDATRCPPPPGSQP
jgi:hypothetical protein